jgi:uncharacterized membrane protein (UPF0127 family)
MLLRPYLFVGLFGSLLLPVQAQILNLPSPPPVPTLSLTATPTPEKVPNAITLHIDKAILSTEVERNETQRQHGLMDRESMPDNAGMLFILPKPEQATFWMKDTLIPLTVAYLDKNGVILEMYDMQPKDETNIVSKSDQVCFAVEVNQHWFELNGIKVGDKVDVSPYNWADFKPE